MKKYTLGFDIGGTKCAVILGKSEFSDENTEGVIVDKIRFDTVQSRGWKTIVDELLSSAESILERNNVAASEVVACGISCGGPLDEREGIILSPPNLPDWKDVPIVGMVAYLLDYIPVGLRNDANACAMAEWRFGAGKGTENMIFLTFGTGLGAGIIANGALLSGANGNAGEAGHLRLRKDGPIGYGKKGSFEGFCSGGGLAQLGKMAAEEAKKQGEPVYWDAEQIDVAEMAAAARMGEPYAEAVFGICGEKLGEGLAVLVDLLNPERIVIGSIFARCEDLLRPAMERALEREALPQALEVCKIVPAALGESIGDRAALAVAMEVLR